MDGKMIKGDAKMNKEELIKKLKKWLDSAKRIKKRDKEIVIFEDGEVFDVFGEKVVNPFDDYSYEWFLYFLDDLISYLEDYDGELEDALDDFEDELGGYVDSVVDVYTSDLTEWLNSNNNNVYYITEVQEEFGPITDGFKLLSMAQYKAIEEVYRGALEVIRNLVEGDE